jgi:hypothetical protein
MLDTVVLVLSLAMIVLFAVGLWSFVKTLIVMGKKSVLLAVLGFYFPH